MGAFIAGLGEGAAPYGQQIRGIEAQKQLQQAALQQQHSENALAAWDAQRQHLNDQITSAFNAENDPTTKAHLADLQVRLMAEKRPDTGAGKDLAPYQQEFMKIHQIRDLGQQHAAAQAAQAEAATKPQPGPPGAALPGQTPGATPMIPPVAGPSGLPERRLGAPVAATPATSPVQPIAQTGGASGQNAPFPGNAAVPSTAPIAPIAGESAGAGPTGSTGPVSPVNDDPELDRLMAEYNRGYLPEGRQKFLEDQISRRTRMGQLRASPEFQEMNPIFKQLYMSSLISGLPEISGTGAMMLPRLLTPGATGADLKRQFPGRPEVAGLDDKTIYRGEIIPLTGSLIISPRTPEIATAQTAGGNIGTINKLNPEAGVTPIAGTIAPSLVTPQTASATQPTPGGGTATTKTERKTIGGVAFPGAPGAATPVPAQSSSTPAPKPKTPAGTTYSHPTPGKEATPQFDTFGKPMTPTRVAQVDNATLNLLRPNQSNAQLSEAMKVYEGSDKWLADQVRARLSQDHLPVMSWDLGTAQRAQFSNQALTHMGTINNLIDQLDKEGKLGPIMSRWEDFMLGKVGAGDPEYAKLRNQIDLMTKALGVVHGGARGGGSIQMYQSFLDKINPAVMNAPSLKAALDVEKEWLTTYANPAQTAGVTTPSSIAPVAGNDPLGVRKFLQGK